MKSLFIDFIYYCLRGNEKKKYSTSKKFIFTLKRLSLSNSTYFLCRNVRNHELNHPL